MKAETPSGFTQLRYDIFCERSHWLAIEKLDNLPNPRGVMGQKTVMCLNNILSIEHDKTHNHPELPSYLYQLFLDVLKPEFRPAAYQVVFTLSSDGDESEELSSLSDSSTSVYSTDSSTSATYTAGPEEDSGSIDHESVTEDVTAVTNSQGCYVSYYMSTLLKPKCSISSRTITALDLWDSIDTQHFEPSISLPLCNSIQPTPGDDFPRIKKVYLKLNDRTIPAFGVIDKHSAESTTELSLSSVKHSNVAGLMLPGVSVPFIHLKLI
eukprot:gnl/Dysnectes_brevis/2442_a2909_1995.p1 GENE.gnl/Dysnectes_brevis/2442_a2909_1995~~gnl/Dysnectes_brevis/2442_a2909_1995.p1  ORF type:complete len:267 (+),score=7.97 gnl/Dysnectes_brevis/2442_a2909_1995:131-931(+)